jgi:hypothetical protein
MREWISRLKANRIVYGEKRQMAIKELGKPLHKEAFREVRVLDKTCWVHIQVLNVNKLGKVRVIICYDSKDLDREPVARALSINTIKLKYVFKSILVQEIKER